jgi:hypothetical protein
MTMAAARFEHPHFQVPEAAAEFDQHRIAGVAQGANLFFALQDADARVLRVAHMGQLDLGDHLSARHRGDETTLVVALACGVADSGHHGRLFRGHGDQPIAAIDPHVGRDADRDVHRADDVLDQVACATRSAGCRC